MMIKEFVVLKSALKRRLIKMPMFMIIVLLVLFEPTEFPVPQKDVVSVTETWKDDVTFRQTWKDDAPLLDTWKDDVSFREKSFV
jgi:hypothetical protein